MFLIFKHVGVGQDRVVDLQHVTVLRSLLQDVAFTDVYGGGSHDLLTDRIDGRVGYLCKQLLEIMKQRHIRLS